ncbi:hypothetical protein ACS0TY_002534 [Phlomoides rotata]
MKKTYESITNPVFKPVGSRFSEEILIDPLPGNFKTLTYEYDGTNDPQDHLLRFENGALLHQYPDGVKCRVILTTLTNRPNNDLDNGPKILSIHSLNCEQYSCTNSRVLEIS